MEGLKMRKQKGAPGRKPQEGELWEQKKAKNGNPGRKGSKAKGRIDDF